MDKRLYDKLSEDELKKLSRITGSKQISQLQTSEIIKKLKFGPFDYQVRWVVALSFFFFILIVGGILFNGDIGLLGFMALAMSLSIAFDPLSGMIYISLIGMITVFPAVCIFSLYNRLSYLISRPKT